MSRSYRCIRNAKNKMFWNEWHNNRQMGFRRYYSSPYNDDGTINLEASEEYWLYDVVNDGANPDYHGHFVKNKKIYKSMYDVLYYPMQNPNWWNRLHTTRPNRCKTHMLEKKAVKDSEMADTLMFPLARHPDIYYW